MFTGTEQIENHCLKGSQASSSFFENFYTHVPIRCTHRCDSIYADEDVETKVKQVQGSLLNADMSLTAIKDYLRTIQAH